MVVNTTEQIQVCDICMFPNKDGRNIRQAAVRYIPAKNNKMKTSMVAL